MLIPKSIQCRIVASLLRGEVPAGYSLARVEELFPAFDEPWQSHLNVLLDAMEVPAGMERLSYINSYVGLNMTAEEKETLRAADEREQGEIPPLADLVLPEIEWVWEHWIPRGMLTVLGAMPSAGKSYVALDLAGRVIAGSEWPDGTGVARAGNVIFVDAENVPQIHNQRAQAWGMDRSKLFLMQPGKGRLIINLECEYDRDRLLMWAWEKRPELIVIDSLASVTIRGENSVEEARGILPFLSRVALEYNCGMVIIHHLRKPGAQLPLPKFLTFNDLRGSSHIVAVSRSIIGLHWVQTGPRQDLNDPRRMEILKTNLCQYPEAVGVEFRPMAADPEVAEIVYGDVVEAYREPTKGEDCEAWLMAVLEEYGEMEAKEVVELGEEEGFGRAMVFRARNKLGEQIVDTKGKHQRGNRWALLSEEEGKVEEV